VRISVDGVAIDATAGAPAAVTVAGATTAEGSDRIA
jgi:hypothetical protein